MFVKAYLTLVALRSDEKPGIGRCRRGCNEIFGSRNPVGAGLWSRGSREASTSAQTEGDAQTVVDLCHQPTGQGSHHVPFQGDSIDSGNLGDIDD